MNIREYTLNIVLLMLVAISSCTMFFSLLVVCDHDSHHHHTSHHECCHCSIHEHDCSAHDTSIDHQCKSQSVEVLEYVISSVNSGFKAMVQPMWSVADGLVYKINLSSICAFSSEYVWRDDDILELLYASSIPLRAPPVSA